MDLGSRLSNINSCITTNTDFDKIDGILRTVKATEPNEAGYDLLQQSIIAANESALSYLLMQGNIPSHHHPTCNEYLLLACKLGHHVMVSMLMEVRLCVV